MNRIGRNISKSVLKNEIRDEIDNRNKIKANIIESNQTVEEFVKRNENIKLISSKEKFFHNIQLTDGTEKYYFYLDNSNPRFWFIHNIEKKENIQNFIEDITTNNYLQDNIYLSHQKLENLQSDFGTSSLGFTLNFDQLFSSDTNSVFQDDVQDFEDIGFTMQLWPKRKKSIQYFIDKLKEIKCPINYKSLNFVFEDEDEVVMKEDLYYNGAITVNRGRDFQKHFSFIEGIRDKYQNAMDEIEANRMDWQSMKGGIYSFQFDKKVNPKEFINILNKKSFESVQNPFKINAFYMYEEENYAMYSCIDTHTGGKFSSKHIQMKSE